MMKTGNTSVLVISCDRYSDLWKPFFAFFDRFWPDCPFPVCLSTNHKVHESQKVKTLACGFESDWSTELLSVIDNVPGKYILVFLEDYFLREPVNTAFVNDAVNFMLKNEGDFMKLTCFPSKYNRLWPYIRDKNDKRFARIRTGAKYEVCLQVALWNKQFLKDLLRKGESPWQFEVYASKRAAAGNAKCFCVVENKFSSGVHGPVNHLCGAVTRGVLMRDAIRMGRKYQIDIDLHARPVETILQEIKRRLRIAMPLSVRHVLDFASSRVNRLTR